MAAEMFETNCRSQIFNGFIECATRVWDRAYSVHLCGPISPLRPLTHDTLGVRYGRSGDRGTKRPEAWPTTHQIPTVPQHLLLQLSCPCRQ
eukprot:1141950-Pelagomonas_calceolata.AAC.1